MMGYYGPNRWWEFPLILFLGWWPLFVGIGLLLTGAI